MKTEILLIRHGQSEGNLQHVFCGQTDVALTETGRKQAEVTAEYLKDRNIDRFYSSPLSRAYETALAAAKYHGKTVEKIEQIAEIYGGEWENVSFEEIKAKYPEELRVWNECIGKSRCPGGESPTDVQERVYPAFESLAKGNEGKTLCVAAHGMVIRVFAARILGISMEKLDSLPWAPNASVTTVEYENGGFRLVEHGYSDHLAELVTTFPDKI